ncbi:response regulator [Candidatus Magnetaquicoccus inordinatus]|uniref:response regulator n=1 Tax=Candidatus Magnetaquicoccus inordinatus TaxID=2496818 RepID=UPI00102B9202|nr:response regulator transcription factor [Candidatus Magnetaquicoccus inordinatus]
MRLLIVEDDQVLANHLKRDLEQANYAVDMVHNGALGEAMANETLYHAIILDLGLPEKSGLTLLKNWRRRGNIVPVIVLTARNTWKERVEGIDAGADDYLGKPFHIEELLARLKAVIYRCHNRVQGRLSVGGYHLDEARQLVITPTADEVSLTAMEFRLLRIFMLAPERIHSKEVLMEALYDFDRVTDHNVIEVYINHLRKKLGKDLFRTLRWQGYRFTPEALS